jgi:hypothetical protein
MAWSAADVDDIWRCCSRRLVRTREFEGEREREKRATRRAHFGAIVRDVLPGTRADQVAGKGNHMFFVRPRVS